MTVLETERLTLRQLRPDDLDELFELYRDPEIRRYYPDGTLTREQTRQELEHFVHGIPDHALLGLWATIHKPTGSFIGRCGLLPWTLDQRQEVEVAFLLAKPFWGQGLATEAARGIVTHAFDILGLRRLVCLVVPGNDASARVAERIGMRFEREFTDEYGRSFLYALEAPRGERSMLVRPGAG